MQLGLQVPYCQLLGCFQYMEVEELLGARLVNIQAEGIFVVAALLGVQSARGPREAATDMIRTPVV